MSTVTFDYDNFLLMFPHIAEAVNEGKTTEEYITETFYSVASWLKADDSSLYPYDPEHGEFTRKTLLYLATCHLVSLSLWGNGQGGRVASASQGSVSTSFDLIKTNSLVGQWWLQTPCGSRYWIQSASYRKGGRFYGVSNYHPYG